MADRLTYLGADERPLEGGWTILISEAGHFAAPGDIHRPAARLPAPVPGTVAEALSKAGLFDPENPQPLDGKDAWYFRSLEGEEPGNAVLRFSGLATIAEVFLNGVLVLSSDSMFESHDLPVTLTGDDQLAICFRALAPHLAKRGPRARWRPQMMSNQGLRLIRTTALGYMPGWCPEIHAAGPWRPISLIRLAKHSLSDVKIRSDLTEDGTGRLSVSLRLAGEQRQSATTITLHCAGQEAAFTRQADGSYTAALSLPGIQPWWPRTHGEPKLYDIGLTIDGRPHSLGLTGFRTVKIDRGTDGKDFAIRLNGQRIFCRGAVWTSADVTRLPGRSEDYAPWLMRAVEAGMNMIRIGGTMAYETPDFFRLCDQLGLLVWQDLMFANFDYPMADEVFVAHVTREVDQLLAGIQTSPSLAIVCGGSEIYQQGAMLGLPESIWKGTFCEQVLKDLTAASRPEVPYVVNSPSGGAMPFSPNEGVSHYYGVGAYCRPLDDARRAGVRFAAESLAFANIPQQRTLDAHLAVPPVHDPRWKAPVPRDRSASWDFEDVRDHYLALLYDVDPARLRRENLPRYMHLSRAVTGEVIEQTFAEWRRPSSSCNGALIWTLQDLMPGAGWGVIDSTGEPKPVWYAARRAFAPLKVTFTDEGTNGLDVHVLNETAIAKTLALEVACLRDGKTPVVTGKHLLTLSPRDALSVSCTDLFGAFFDTTYAFRFGPPSHDVTVATLVDNEKAEIVSQAFHFPQGRAMAMRDAAITATLVEDNGLWCIDLISDGFAQSVHVDLEAYRAEDDWFHMAPGQTRRLRLLPRDGAAASQKPAGEITTAGSSRTVRF
ncbi:glycoside hydrolase family 2 protein [Agrobacterium sp. a22-2]|uniref:glycoside hydrolase family 2 protein n=1 Tax=Agrobacterium sp. a22-2 TaxID=2283840 RepID=UPI001447D43F|nr:glycoside hydrolase family 2 protein [Agrobacterium sp. a22-2]NKN39727.1 glycoside hydrolase family 2 protein [Agrobacterium sp. a22-2]